VDNINWTQIVITLISVIFGAGGAYGIFLAHRRVMRAENNENQRINRIITDERVDVVWQQTLDMFTAERERTKQDFAELRALLAHETTKRREVESTLLLEQEARRRLEAELRTEQEARRRIEGELDKERQERKAEKEQTMQQILDLKQENANLKRRLLVQEKKDKQL